MLQVPRADEQGQHHPQAPLRRDVDTEAHPARVRPIMPSSTSPAPGRTGAGQTATPTTTTRRPGGSGPALLAPSRPRAAVTPVPHRSCYPANTARASLPPSGHRAAQPGTPRPSPAPCGQLRGCRSGRPPSGPVPTPEEPPARPGPSPLTSPRSCSMAPKTPLARLTRAEHVPPLSGASDWREPGKESQSAKSLFSPRSPRGTTGGVGFFPPRRRGAAMAPHGCPTQGRRRGRALLPVPRARRRGVQAGPLHPFS